MARDYTYYEATIDGESDGPFRIFVIEKKNKSDAHFSQYAHYELTSSQFIGCVDEDRDWFGKEYNNIKLGYDKLIDRHSPPGYACSGRTDSHEVSLLNFIAYFEKLEKDTQNGIPRWRNFFIYKVDKWRSISATELSKYLEEIESHGEAQYYADYVKSVVLNNQRKYLEAIRPYYEQCKAEYEAECEAEKREAEAKKREAEAENSIANFMKKLGVKLPQ